MDGWFVILEYIPLLMQQLKQLLQLCKDLRIVMNMGKTDLELVSKAHYLRMLIDTI